MREQWIPVWIIGLVIGFPVCGYGGYAPPSSPEVQVMAEVGLVADAHTEARDQNAEMTLQNIVGQGSYSILEGRPYSGRIKQRVTKNGHDTLVSMLFSGDFSKMDMTGPEGRQVIIVNQDGYFVYTPAERKAIQMMEADDPEALRRFGRLNPVGTLAAMESLDVNQFRFLREEEFKGEMCSVYEVEGPKDSVGTLTYWVAPGYHYPLKVEQDRTDGQRVIEFLEFEPNVHVPRSEFRIPGRVKVLNLAGDEIETIGSKD